MEEFSFAHRCSKAYEYLSALGQSLRSELFPIAMHVSDDKLRMTGLVTCAQTIACAPKSSHELITTHIYRTYQYHC